MKLNIKFIPAWLTAVAKYHGVGLGEVEQHLTPGDKTLLAKAQFFLMRTLGFMGLDTNFNYVCPTTTSDIQEAMLAALGSKSINFKDTPNVVFSLLTITEAKEFDGVYVSFELPKDQPSDSEVLQGISRVYKELYIALATKVDESTALKSQVFAKYISSSENSRSAVGGVSNESFLSSITGLFKRDSKQAAQEDHIDWIKNNITGDKLKSTVSVKTTPVFLPKDTRSFLQRGGKPIVSLKTVIDEFEKELGRYKDVFAKVSPKVTQAVAVVTKLRKETVDLPQQKLSALTADGLKSIILKHSDSLPPIPAKILGADTYTYLGTGNTSLFKPLDNTLSLDKSNIESNNPIFVNSADEVNKLISVITKITEFEVDVWLKYDEMVNNGLDWTDPPFRTLGDDVQKDPKVWDAVQLLLDPTFDDNYLDLYRVMTTHLQYLMSVGTTVVRSCVTHS